MGNFGLNARVPGLHDTESRELFVSYENRVRTMLVTLLLNLQDFRDNVESVWSNLRQKVIFTNHIDAVQILDFVSNLDQQQKVL